MSDYCQIWKMVVNVNKTKVMLFRQGRNVSFLYNENEIFLKRPNMHTFIELFMSENETIVNNLAQFIYNRFLKEIISITIGNISNNNTISILSSLLGICRAQQNIFFINTHLVHYCWFTIRINILCNSYLYVYVITLHIVTVVYIHAYTCCILYIEWRG